MPDEITHGTRDERGEWVVEDGIVGGWMMVGVDRRVGALNMDHSLASVTNVPVRVLVPPDQTVSHSTIGYSRCHQLWLFAWIASCKLVRTKFREHGWGRPGAKRPET